MKKISAFLLILSIFTFNSCTTSELLTVAEEILTAGGGSGQLSPEMITRGLKEALVQGATNGTRTLSVADGFFKNPNVKIPFPKEAQNVVDKLKVVPGFNNVENEATRFINRAAEDAAKRAIPVFKSAITKMTISDAKKILMGNSNEATQYLKKTTSDQLFRTFRPVIKNSLNKVKAADYWDKIITNYNKIPLVKKVDVKLDEYVTGKAMDGVFFMVEKEEKLIRKDPKARATEVLKKVFAAQDR